VTVEKYTIRDRWESGPHPSMVALASFIRRAGAPDGRVPFSVLEEVARQSGFDREVVHDALWVHLDWFSIHFTDLNGVDAEPAVVHAAFRDPAMAANVLLWLSVKDAAPSV
jgi:hypothetical protein